MSSSRFVRVVIVLVAAPLLGCTARENNELSAALAPVPEDELPRFEKRADNTPLDVGITGRPPASEYIVDLPLEFPSNELTPIEQAEFDRLEREKFTYDWLDLADIKKPNPLVGTARGGSDAGISHGIPSIGVVDATPVSIRAGAPAPAPDYGTPAIVATQSAAYAGANPSLSESTRSALQIAPATQLVTIDD